jgi:hypothetical protein
LLLFLSSILQAYVVWCVRGGECGGRVIFGVGGGMGQPPAHHPALKFFFSRPRQKKGLGGRAILCWFDLELAVVHF